MESEKEIQSKIPKDIKKKLTERDVEILSKVLENVTVTKSGMLRTSNFFVPNPKFSKEFSEGMKAIQEIPETLRTMNKTQLRVLMELSHIKQIIGRR